MVRGIVTFKCEECGHTFEALDIEYNATVYSVPATCPKCGSKHTVLFGVGTILGKTISEIYDKIKKVIC